MPSMNTSNDKERYCFMEEVCRKKNEDHNFDNIFSVEYGTSVREDEQGNERALSVVWTGDIGALAFVPPQSGDAAEI